jgi:hypothetical protein
LVRLRLVLLGFSMFSFGLRSLVRRWRCPGTPASSSQSSSTQGWVSTAMSTSTDLLGFFLSSSLLEASH